MKSTKSNLFDKKSKSMILTLAFSGVILRLLVMCMGNNFDFDSYCIVGNIAGHFENVYENTTRYNYGPLFFFIQGFLWRVSELFGIDCRFVFRTLIVLFLTCVDLGIMVYITRKYSWKKGILFFLNPISIIITGYHNQFDNLAILLALISLNYYNEDEKIGKKDWLFVLFMALSLIAKHILFIFPIFILFRKGLNVKKKIMYAALPPLFFLLSFIPFAVSSRVAFEGIVQNVFFYRSFNNAPLLSIFYKLIGFPENMKMVVYICLMCSVAFALRKENRRIEDILMLYLISMVAFSSAIANQYLAIPMVALCVLNTGVWKYIYFFTTTVFLVLHGDGLELIYLIGEKHPGWVENICRFYVTGGYILAAWILFAVLLDQLYKSRKGMIKSGKLV